MTLALKANEITEARNRSIGSHNSMYPEFSYSYSFDIERFDGPISTNANDAFMKMKAMLLKELEDAEQYLFHGKEPSSFCGFTVQYKPHHRNF